MPTYNLSNFIRSWKASLCIVCIWLFVSCLKNKKFQPPATMENREPSSILTISSTSLNPENPLRTGLWCCSLVNPWNKKPLIIFLVLPQFHKSQEIYFSWQHLLNQIQLLVKFITYNTFFFSKIKLNFIPGIIIYFV